MCFPGIKAVLLLYVRPFPLISPSKKVAQILLQGLRSPPYRSSSSARISPSRSRGLVMADRGRRALPIGNRLTNDRWVSHCQVCSLCLCLCHIHVCLCTRLAAGLVTACVSCVFPSFLFSCAFLLKAP